MTLVRMNHPPHPHPTKKQLSIGVISRVKVESGRSSVCVSAVLRSAASGGRERGQERENEAKGEKKRL